MKTKGRKKEERKKKERRKKEERKNTGAGAVKSIWWGKKGGIG